MGSIDFQSREEKDSFIKSMREGSQSRWVNQTTSVGAWLNREWLFLLGLNSGELESASTSLIVCAVNDILDIPLAEWLSVDFYAPIVAFVEINFGLKVNNVLWEAMEWWEIRQLPIKNYAHRLLETSVHLRGTWCAQFLHETMNNVVGDWNREITLPPSLLLFYMKQWLSVDSIHIKLEWEEIYTHYQLDDRQRRIISQFIIWCFQEGYKSLPFFVELHKTQSWESQLPVADFSIIPEWLKELKRLTTVRNDLEDGRFMYWLDRRIINVLDTYL